MFKGISGQKWIVFAFGGNDHATPGAPITGDAANITANIRQDGGAAAAVEDTNPTELEGGTYAFDLTADETDGNLLSLHPVSATPDVEVIALPGTIYTTLDNNSGVGAWPVSLTIKLADNTPVPDCDVVLTSLVASITSGIVASGQTNGSGTVLFNLDPGTYYLWRQKSGIDFTNPRNLTVNADGTYGVS